jgi:hypothetical protein
MHALELMMQSHHPILHVVGATTLHRGRRRLGTPTLQTNSKYPAGRWPGSESQTRRPESLTCRLGRPGRRSQSDSVAAATGPSVTGCDVTMSRCRFKFTVTARVSVYTEPVTSQTRPGRDAAASRTYQLTVTADDTSPQWRPQDSET